jgi:23S rRNA (cytosine1962-C5)-methyltransferase
VFASDQYELLDFGEGRKLERFGAQIVDRPAPAATDAVRRRDMWSQATISFDRDERTQGKWSVAAEIDAPWTVHHDAVVFTLKPSPLGQVGLFAEQAENWDWIAARVRSAGRPLKVLNLFAYTGGSTLAAAAAGAEVTHVDAARSAIAWARRNAIASGMEDAPIHWIQEDAMKFVRRELKRGRQYDAVILDPPSFGRGPKGETWKLTEHLSELLSLCCALTEHTRCFVLLTCHSGELAFGEALLEFLRTSQPELRRHGSLSGQDLWLVSRAGGRVHCGAAVRWCKCDVGNSHNAGEREAARSIR